MGGRDDEIARLYASGKLIKEIATTVGMAPNSVGQALKRLGFSRPGKPQRKIKDVDHDVICRLWDHGLSTAAIAERVQASRQHVASILVDRGYDIKAAHRQRFDGVAGSASRRGSGNSFARIARRT